MLIREVKRRLEHGNKSRPKLGIFLSALVFVGNYLPWVRQAASLPDTLTLSSGQIHLIQNRSPMICSVQGEAVSVLGFAG